LADHIQRMLLTRITGCQSLDYTKSIGDNLLFPVIAVTEQLILLAVLHQMVTLTVAAVGGILTNGLMVTEQQHSAPKLQYQLLSWRLQATR